MAKQAEKSGSKGRSRGSCRPAKGQATNKKRQPASTSCKDYNGYQPKNIK